MGKFIVLWITVTVISVAAWFTHVVTCIQDEAWAFLIGGAIFIPVGVVHGIGIWFGLF